MTYIVHSTEHRNIGQRPWIYMEPNITSIGPRISVIIPVFNNKLYIEKSIRSVILQQYSNVELIIIDGGSTDGSLEIIKMFTNSISHFVSESDKGIYDAMNKGIEKATGEWLYFLGSDDFLEPDVFPQLIPYFSSSKMLIYGDVRFDNGLHFSSFLNKRTIFQNTVHHQSAFYNRKLFLEFRYNVNLRILSDYELNLFIYKHQLLTQKISITVACCHVGGASSQISLAIRETNEVRRKYFKNKFVDGFLSSLLHIYYIQKKIRKLF